MVASAHRQFPQVPNQPGADFSEILSSIAERPGCGQRCDCHGNLTGWRGQHSHLPHEILTGR